MNNERPEISRIRICKSRKAGSQNRLPAFLCHRKFRPVTQEASGGCARARAWKMLLSQPRSAQECAKGTFLIPLSGILC